MVPQLKLGWLNSRCFGGIRIQYFQVPKWSKMIIALLLVPVCIGAAEALWRVIDKSGGADTVWVPMFAGALCWLVVYVLLPKPIWIYVFGHELTHAIWTWVFGGRVKRFRATSNGGHVVVTKSNFVVALAPYFFPLYAVAVVAIFLGGHWIWDWTRYAAWFHLLLGAAYTFHVTLTLHILKTRQSDITEQGCVFSAVIIFLGNTAVLLLGIPLLTPQVGILAVMRWWMDGTWEVFRSIGRLW